MAHLPASSYRLQLSQSFTLKDAEKALPYLQRLGIEMVYTSPCFEIVVGSQNPYMITNPAKIAKSLGGEEAFTSFCVKCQELGLQHMMDIVPNHMAAHPENPWWQDVLEHGQSSPYASYFDIDWEDASKHGVTRLDAKNIHGTINYRRFFDICDMVGLNIEHDNVFQAYFQAIAGYVKNGWVQGFRIDHIDGLKKPRHFLDKVKASFPHVFLYLEKILQDGELLREGWPVEGCVGYEVLYLIDQVLLDVEGEKPLTDLYQQVQEERFVDLPKIKTNYLQKYLSSEVDRFSRWFGCSKDELLVFLSHFPIYRTYIEEEGELAEEDCQAIQQASKHCTGSFFPDEVVKPTHRKALMKLQQILPAVFAKGFEDTYNYRYLRLTSLNEVGGKPQNFSITNDYFHQRVQQLFQSWPYTMHVLSTHDTKRSLDARMRLHCLAEDPDCFRENLSHWYQLLDPFESPRMMYFFLQSLLAISGERQEERVLSYMVKAAREGKYYSDHLTPDTAFERRLCTWVQKALRHKEFMKHFTLFKEQLAEAAERKSLSALVLQFGLPGVMDLYQGEELTAANLVDPDNRRSVDFDLCCELLQTAPPKKMEVIYAGLHARSQYRKLFQEGEYKPLQTGADQVGFRRELNKQAAVVLVNKFHFKKNKRPFLEVPSHAKSLLPEPKGDFIFYLEES